MERGQGEALIPMVDALLKQAGLSPADVKRVAVSVGPGSFTGVRVGLAAARGMGLALHVPVVGITTLAAAAYQVPAETVLAVADTKRGDFFTQLFRGGRCPSRLSRRRVFASQPHITHKKRISQF